MGCADLAAPPNTTVVRDGDRLTVRCNHSEQIWYLVCINASWHGETINCNNGFFLPRSIHVYRRRYKRPHRSLVTPRGGELIRPLSALSRHIRQQRHTNSAECTHAYNGPVSRNHMYLQKCPLPCTPVCPTHRQTDRQTDRDRDTQTCTCDICINRPHLCIACRRCGLNIPKDFYK